MTRNRIEQHPDEFRRDLNPHYQEGENYGEPHYQTVPAYEIKEIHRRFPNLRDDELKRIPLVVESCRLEQGAAYIDLRHPERGEFFAMGNMVAGPDNWYVPKSEVEYRLWNFLTGVESPERLRELAEEHHVTETPPPGEQP